LIGTTIAEVWPVLFGEIIAEDFFSPRTVISKAACPDFDSAAVGVSIEDDVTGLIALASRLSQVEPRPFERRTFPSLFRYPPA
jgi:hypothetical protein